MPAARVNAAAFVRGKMNIGVVLFIVLKGTATYHGLPWRLYLEVNYSPMDFLPERPIILFMSLIIHIDGVNLYALTPASCASIVAQ